MLKLSKIEKTFERMKVPFAPWKPDSVKVVGDYRFIIQNCGNGNIDYYVEQNGKEIFYKNDCAGDYEFNKKKVIDDLENL